MTKGEAEALKKLLHAASDEALPEIIKAEIARLPDAYEGLALALVSAILPAIQVKIGALIDAHVVGE